MRKWCVKIFLSVIFLSLSFADHIRHDINELKKCEGETVKFSYPFELKEYILVKWTFSALSTPTDIAKSKDIEKAQIEYLADGYEGRLKVFPDSAIKFSLHQISRKDNGTYTFIIFHGNGDKDIFKWNLQVEAVKNITKPSVTINIVSGTECTEYICSTKQKDVHMAWIYQSDKQIKGSTLRLCSNNRSRAVSCIVKAACSSNYKTITEEDEKAERIVICKKEPTIFIILFITSTLLLVGLLVALVYFKKRRRPNTAMQGNPEENERL